MNIQPINDKEELRAFLDQDAAETAYALGDLEPALWDDAEFIGAYADDDMLQAIVLLYHGFEIPTVCIHGDAEFAYSILEGLELPPTVMVLCPEDHRETISDFYETSHLYDLYRMTVTPETFERPYVLLGGDKLARLTEEHIEELNALYAEAAESDAEAIIAFSPEQISMGYFVGMYSRETGELLGAAGTHIASKQENIAAVGNVYTKPKERGRGIGTLMTASVTQYLFHNDIERVVLNVKQTNSTAIHIYEKLGYRVYSDFIEGPAELK